jgi:DNA-binding CsgD family transcriptional regulator
MNHELHIYMRDSGSSRVLWRPEHVDRPWHQLSCGELMLETEVKDRIYMASALSPSLELTLCLDAHLTQDDFTEHDAHFAQALLIGLQPFVLRMALSHGLLEGQGRLSPRERETLLLLLKGGSEKEIAQALGLSPKTLHQYVISLYRKFNVRSRPELMALWLEPPMKLLKQVL